MIYLLDTDHTSALQDKGIYNRNLTARLRTVAPDDYGTTIVSYEEQVRGRLAQVAAAKNTQAEVNARALLYTNLQFYSSLSLWQGPFESLTKPPAGSLSACSVSISASQVPPFGSGGQSQSAIPVTTTPTLLLQRLRVLFFFVAIGENSLGKTRKLQKKLRARSPCGSQCHPACTSCSARWRG